MELSNDCATPNILNKNSHPENSFSWGSEDSKIQLGLYTSFNTIKTGQNIWWLCSIRNKGEKSEVIRISDKNYGDYLYSIQVFHVNETIPFYEQKVAISTPVIPKKPGEQSLNLSQEEYLSVEIPSKGYKELSLATISSKFQGLSPGEYKLKAKFLLIGNDTISLYSDFFSIHVTK